VLSIHEVQHENFVRRFQCNNMERRYLKPQSNKLCHIKKFVMSTMFPHCSSHKYTLTSDGKTHNQTDHILIDEIQHSSTVDIH
jgi:hypothetical protein